MISRPDFMLITSVMLDVWFTRSRAIIFPPQSNMCALNNTMTNPPALVPENLSAKCHCFRESKQCYTLITWTQPQHDSSRPDVTAYRLTFWENEEDERSKVCHRLLKESRTFNFSCNEDHPIMSYTLTAEPVYLPTLEELNHYFSCPERIEILNELPDNKEVNIGGSYTFNCTFKGYPLPDPDGDDITWTFTPLGSTAETILHNNKHIKIIKGSHSTALAIINTEKIHEGRYKCVIRNYFGEGYGAEKRGSLLITIDEVENRMERILGPVLGTVAGISLLLVVIVTLSRYFTEEYTKGKVVHIAKRKLYVSHAASTARQREKLLNFASRVELQVNGITVIIDLTRQTEINNAGGFSQWVPEQMAKADKILVAMSEEYQNALEAYDGRDGDGDKDKLTLKVLSEYDFIEKLLHQSHQVTDRLIVASLGGKLENPPAVFEGRSCFLQNITEHTVNDQDFINWLCDEDMRVWGNACAC